MTVLLALVVFLLLVAETLPPQSESVPLLGKYKRLAFPTNLCEKSLHFGFN